LPSKDAFKITVPAGKANKIFADDNRFSLVLGNPVLFRKNTVFFTSGITPFPIFIFHPHGVPSKLSEQPKTMENR